MAPSFVRSLMTNVALAKLGRRARTVYHPLAACYLVTYRCELRCVYCLENLHHRPAGELETEDVLRTLAGIRQVTDTIDITGGEPALRADLEEILGSCRELEFGEIMLNSNGIRLLEQLPALRHAHSVMLGIDAFSEEGFVRVTGGTPDQHRAQREALDTLERLQAEHGFDLQLCTVLLADHLDEIEPILDWCFRRKVMISVSPHIDEEHHVERRLREHPRYAEITARLVEHKRAGRPLLGTLAYYRALHDLGRHECLPMANMTVSPTGEMFWPCGEIQHRGPRFLDGKPYRDMVDEARVRFGPPPECGDRCHFSCHLAFSTIVGHPLELPAERGFMKRYKRHAR